MSGDDEGIAVFGRSEGLHPIEIRAVAHCVTVIPTWAGEPVIVLGLLWREQRVHNAVIKNRVFIYQNRVICGCLRPMPLFQWIKFDSREHINLL